MAITILRHCIWCTPVYLLRWDEVLRIPFEFLENRCRKMKIEKPISAPCLFRASLLCALFTILVGVFYFSPALFRMLHITISIRVFRDFFHHVASDSGAICENTELCSTKSDRKMAECHYRCRHRRQTIQIGRKSGRRKGSAAGNIAKREFHTEIHSNCLRTCAQIQ